MIKRQSLGKNNLFVFSSRIGSKVITLFFMTYLARKLSPENFGELTLYLTAANFLALIQDLGSNVVLVREIASGKIIDFKKYTDSILGLKTITSLFTFFIVFIMIGYFFDDQVKIYLLFIFAIGSFFESVLLTTVKFFESAERMEFSSFLIILERIVIITIFFVFSEFISVLESFGTSYLFANLASFAIGFVIISKVTTFRIEVDYSIIKSTFKASLPFLLFNILSVVYNRIDILIIATYGTNAQIGAFRAVFQLIESFFFLSITLNVSLLPFFSRIYNFDHLRLRKFFIKIFYHLILLGIVISLILSISSSDILLLLYKNKYKEYEFFLSICASIIPIYFANNLCGNMLIAFRKESYQISSMMFSTIVKLILIIPMFLEFNLIGLFFSMLLSEIVAFYFQFREIKSELKFRLIDIIENKRIVFIIISFVILIQIYHNYFLNLVLGIILLTYLLLTFLVILKEIN